jgi:protein-disulfide isomerase
MALKDRLNDALNSTDNIRRRETLQGVLAAAGAGSDAEIQVAIAKIIGEHEQKAASYNLAGQTDLAKAERDEIDILRVFLRASAGEPTAAPKAKAKPVPGSSGKATPGPLISRTQMVIVGVAAVVLAVIAYLLLRPAGSGEGDVLATDTTKATITVLADDRTMGNSKAPITMLEYAAPTCPHCAHFAMDVMPLIKKNYIDTGKVFYIFRTFPLSATDGAVEAIARRCLPADKYFGFIDLMFRNQSKWDPDGYQVPDVHAAIVQMARVYGISADRVDECITNKDEQQRINQVAQDGETKYNIQGTPTFVINGTVVQAGEDDWPDMKARLDSLLSKK